MRRRITDQSPDSFLGRMRFNVYHVAANEIFVSAYNNRERFAVFVLCRHQAFVDRDERHRHRCGFFFRWLAIYMYYRGRFSPDRAMAGIAAVHFVARPLPLDLRLFGEFLEWSPTCGNFGVDLLSQRGFALCTPAFALLYHLVIDPICCDRTCCAEHTRDLNRPCASRLT